MSAADLAERDTALAAAGVADPGVRAKLAARWPVDVIRAGVRWVAKLKRVDDRGAMLVHALSRGIAAAEAKRARDAAERAAAVADGRAESAASAASAEQAARERERMERDAMRERLARTERAALVEAVAVALAALDRPKLRTVFARLNVQRGTGWPIALAETLAVHYLLRPLVAARLDEIERGEQRVMSDEAEAFAREFNG